MKTQPKKNLLKLTGFALFLLLISTSAWSIHPELDTLDFWVQINDGLGKCSEIGESGPWADVRKDDFTVKQVLHRRGLMYARVVYGDEAEDPEPCEEGWYVHDTIENRWYRVADEPPIDDLWRGRPSKYVTNGMEIFYVFGTQVAQLTFDYDQYPSGWKYLNQYPYDVQDLNNVLPEVCVEAFSDYNVWTIEAIGDTIFSLLKPRDRSSCSEEIRNQPSVLKFDVTTGTYTGEVMYWPVDDRPWWFGSQHVSATVTDYIGGHFRYFITFSAIHNMCGPSATDTRSLKRHYRDLYGIENDDFILRDSVMPYWDRAYDPVPCAYDAYTGELLPFNPDPEDFAACHCGFSNNYSSNFNDDALPKITWVFDPRVDNFRLMERGPKWANFTGNRAFGGGLTPSWDHKRVFMGNQQGTYEWLGDRWEHHNNRTKSIAIPTTNGIFYNGGGDREGGPFIERFINANFMIIGPFEDPHSPCETPQYNTKYKRLATPDDGRTLYGIYSDATDEKYCDTKTYKEDYEADYGVYFLRVDQNKRESTRNLHVETLTYIGGPDSENPGVGNQTVNLGIGANYQIYVAGTFASVTGDFADSFNEKFYNGADASSPGKIIVYNKRADKINQVIHLGNYVYTYEMQNWGEWRMVVAGTWGVSVLDSAGVELWTKPYTDFNIADQTPDPFGGIDKPNALQADIDDLGNVVVLQAREKRFYVFDKDGNLKNPGGTSTNATSTEDGPLGTVYNTGSFSTNSVAILNDTVFVGGFNKQNMYDTKCGDGGSSSGKPVHSAFLRAFTYNSSESSYNYLYRLFDFRGNYLGADQADAIVAKLNVGRNNKLYILGWTHAANGVFRWNGKVSVTTNAFLYGTCDQGTNHGDKIAKVIGPYSSLSIVPGDNSPTFAFVGVMDPVKREVETGQNIAAIMSDGTGNSFGVMNGYIHADEKGFVYVLGNSAYQYANREVQYVNGKKIGNYAGGDGVLAMYNPEMNARIFMGCFHDSLAQSATRGIAIRDNWVAMTGTTHSGKMITGGTRVVDPLYNITKFKREWAMHPDPFNWGLDLNAGPIGAVDLNDAFVATFYQDVWNYSQDTLEPNHIPGDTVISFESFNCNVDFKVNEMSEPAHIIDHVENHINICLDDEITIEDASLCAEEWEWDFGDGARVGPQFLNRMAYGEGPWKVKYTTPGVKKVKLNAKIRSENVDGSPSYKWVLREKEEIYVIDDNLTLQNINAPSQACAGTQMSVSVPHEFAIVEYEWTVPEGTVILDGATGNKIRVELGETSGDFTVRALMPCGSYTPVKTKSMDITTPDENTMLMVVGTERVVIDNEDTDDYYFTKPFPDNDDFHAYLANDEILTERPGYYSTNYWKFKLHCHVSTKGDVFEVDLAFAPELPERAYYEVHIRFPYVKGDDDLPMQIDHLGGTTDLLINQRYTGGKEWISLGTYEFEAGKAIVARYPFRFSYWSEERDQDNYLIDALSFTKVGPEALSAGDAKIVERLETNLSKNVIVKRDYALHTADLACASAAYVSHTVDEVAVSDKFKDASLPVIVANPELYSRLGLSYAQGNVGVKSDVETVKMQNSTHELSAGFAGEISVFSPQSKATWGRPSEASIVIAEDSDDDSLFYIFAYDDECPMHGGYVSAPERRVAFFLEQNAAGDLSPQGWELFDQAICWSFRNCAAIGGSHSIDMIGAETDICPGGNIEVMFMANGEFGTDPSNPCSAVNKFSFVMSDRFGNFTNGRELWSIDTTAGGLYIVSVPVPMDLVPGGTYRVRVVSSMPSAVSEASDPINVRSYPQDAGPITGKDKFCFNEDPMVADYSVEPRGVEYKWEIPLGARFVPDTLAPPIKTELITISNQVRINFGVSTDQRVDVYMRDDCGWSLDPSRLNVERDGTPPGPNIPDKVRGAEVICPDGIYTYSVPIIYYTDEYHWDIDASLGTILDTDDNAVTIRASSTDGNTGRLSVYAENACGITPVVYSAEIEINKSANVPQFDGGITVKPGACDGQYRVSVRPVIDADQYDWTFDPPKGEVVSSEMLNEVDIVFTEPGTYTVTAHATNGCGTGSVSTEITATMSGRRALLFVRDEENPRPLDNEIIARLATLGYETTLVEEGYKPGQEVYCNQVIVISPDLDDSDDLPEQFKSLQLPIVAAGNTDLGRKGITTDLGMIDGNPYSGTKHSYYSEDQTHLDIVSNCHPITAHLTVGQQLAVFSSSARMGWSIPTWDADPTILAMIPGTTENEVALFVYEKGDPMFELNAPERRVGLFMGKDNAGKVTEAGWVLFDKTIEWAVGKTSTPLMSVPAMSNLTLCRGEEQSLSFNIDDPGYATPHELRAELSNESGVFAPGTYHEIGSVTSSTSGNIPVTIPEGIPLSKHYRLRIVNDDCSLVFDYTTPVEVDECGACPELITDTIVQEIACAGDNSGSIQLVMLEGRDPYTINWSSGASSELLSSLSAGTYEVTVEDNIGCQDNLSFTFDEPDAMSATVSISHVSCGAVNDGAILFENLSGGSGSYQYSVDGAVNWHDSSVVSGLTGGVYDTWIRDSLNSTCQIQLDDQVRIDSSETIEIITYQIEESTQCGIDSASITLEALAGTEDLAYSLDGDLWQASGIFEGLPSGTYTPQIRFVSDTSCVRILNDTTIVSPDLPVIDTVYFQGVENCLTNDGYIALEVSGVDDPEYSIDGDQWQTDSLFDNLHYGTYVPRVRPQSSPSCVVLNEEVLIAAPDMPEVDLGNDLFLCTGDTATIGTQSGYALYVWNGVPGTDSMQVYATGQYKVEVSNASGCKVADSIQIDVVDALNLFASDTVWSCLADNKSFAIQALEDTDYIYTWDAGSDSSSQEAVLPGTYTVTVEDQYGCITIDSVVHKKYPNIQISIDAGDTLSHCAEKWIRLSAVENPQISSYQWSNDSVGQSAQFYTDASHELVLSGVDVNGCTVTDQLYLNVIAIA